MSVRDAAARVGLSQRHFINLFTTQVGLSPKLFCRLLRFQRAVRLVQPTGMNHLGHARPGRAVHETSWADVAVECGYFDQSHLIRDFHDFSRMAPTHFCRGLSADLKKNHIAMTA
jgi:transcriptional regulator GlxA family with amidase domain